MSKNKSPFPDVFDLSYNRQVWNGRRYVVSPVDVVAVKDNGWYKIYLKSEMNLPTYRRHSTHKSMRWYELENHIQLGHFSLLDDRDEYPIDITSLI